MNHEISLNIQDLPQEITIDFSSIDPSQKASLIQSLKGQILYNSRDLDVVILRNADLEDIAVHEISNQGDSVTLRIENTRESA